MSLEYPGLRVSFIGKRGEAAKRWCRAWARVCQTLGSSSVSDRDVTNLGARFPRHVDMDNVADVLMYTGFSVALDGSSVHGFPTNIQDPVTGDSTRFEGLD